MSERNMISRRNFLAFGTGVLGSTLALACGGGAQQSAESDGSAAAEMPAGGSAAKTAGAYAGLRVGVQSYCFRNFRDHAQLKGFIHTLGLQSIELWPDGHLPVDTPADELARIVADYKADGISIDACGVVGFKNDEAAARKIFEYAKVLGVLGISAAPSHDALPLMVKLTEEYGIPIAIHNHGPGDKLYGTAELIREHLAPLPSSVGLCVDTGHFQRVGADPLAVIDEFAERINGLHLKDMVLTGEKNDRGDPLWEDAIIGKGSLDLPALVRKLKEIGFDGYCSLEYESDPDNPIPAMQECLAELRSACEGVA
ncbi:MAG: sugar phosphate isomerase/epimerase [Candidatus Glassbacteria bacterium]|nr:sugar phosphate isomerase/epimerase [Candidatus Glassbacteria bacterium]